ncbi:MAG: bifunctional adenosylcobinamide kinase/adenosylcobinamide-phosphate guanylyltransferase [Spirochaetales bacterium]|nr:bifunctional adenosylcobinamide kinase/adenosylcobinamide-phosphate guanylyltransferase [Spirochaetales bacterium]
MEKKVYFVLGGVRSGKSDYAQSLAARLFHRVVFCATAGAHDEEMKDRILKHRKKRPGPWHTIEAPLHPAEALRAHIKNTEAVLVDCLTIFTANHLLAADADRHPEYTKTIIEKELVELMYLYDQNEASLIFVSNEVGTGVVPPTPLGRRYRDLLGWVNIWVGRKADHLILMTAGIPLDIKQLHRTQEPWLREHRLM